jgi:polyhydroxybutyrate depolymerase
MQHACADRYRAAACLLFVIFGLGSAHAEGNWTTITVDERVADAFVPSCVKPDSPIILSLHAWATNKGMQQKVDLFSEHTWPECPVIVYPEAKARGLLFGCVGFAWNAGGCCPNGDNDHVDDMSFLRNLITKTGVVLSIRTSAIFVVGLSNGGMMANRLACSDSRIKAMVVVSSVLTNGTDSPRTEVFPCSRKVPILHFHGFSDPIVPWNGCNSTSGDVDCKSLMIMGGGAFAPMQPVLQYIDDWRTRNGVSGGVGNVTFTNQSATCTSWGNVDSNVTLCTLAYMGHAWPGRCQGIQKVLPFMMNCSMDIDASSHAMAFLRKQITSTHIVV